MDSVAVRRPCYVHEDDGLASLPDMEACFSGNCNSICHSTQICSPGGVFRSRPYGSPRYDEERPPHFLESCFLCKKQLGNNRDIFMYRGDTAFCSEECRQEQIDMDDAEEKKKINLSSSIEALRKKKQQQESTNRDYKPFHPGAVAAA